MTFNIIVHYPKTPGKIQELERLTAAVYAQTVTQYVERLPCSKSQKLALISAVQKTINSKQFSGGRQTDVHPVKRTMDNPI